MEAWGGKDGSGMETHPWPGLGPSPESLNGWQNQQASPETEPACALGVGHSSGQWGLIWGLGIADVTDKHIQWADFTQPGLFLLL